MELIYIRLRYSSFRRVNTRPLIVVSKDCEGKSILLGVSGRNLSVYRPSNYVRINSFAWCKILRVFYKKKRFFIQLQREKVTHLAST